MVFVCCRVQGAAQHVGPRCLRLHDEVFAATQPRRGPRAPPTEARAGQPACAHWRQRRPLRRAGSSPGDEALSMARELLPPTSTGIPPCLDPDLGAARRLGPGSGTRTMHRLPSPRRPQHLQRLVEAILPTGEVDPERPELISQVAGTGHDREPPVTGRSTVASTFAAPLGGDGARTAGRSSVGSTRRLPAECEGRDHVQGLATGARTSPATPEGARW